MNEFLQEVGIVALGCLGVSCLIAVICLCSWISDTNKMVKDLNNERCEIRKRLNNLENS